MKILSEDSWSIISYGLKPKELQVIKVDVGQIYPTWGKYR